MLKSRNTPDTDKDGDEEMPVSRLAQCLAQHYPSHGFVISRDALERFGLVTKKAEEYDYWPQLKSLFAAYSQGSFAEQCNDSVENHFICAWTIQDFTSFFCEQKTESANTKVVSNEDEPGKNPETPPATQPT